MDNIRSMRGVKELENAHSGENKIFTAVIDGNTVTKTPNKKLHTTLLTHLISNKTLLWVYSESEGVETITFGYDKHFHTGKIGHAALVDKAIIAGEIRKLGSGTYGSGWCISNESGAWGAMGRVSGKSHMLRTVANTMTDHLGIIVKAEVAFSRNAIKRKLQEFTRGNKRKFA